MSECFFIVSVTEQCTSQKKLLYNYRFQINYMPFTFALTVHSKDYTHSVIVHLTRYD